MARKILLWVDTMGKRSDQIAEKWQVHKLLKQRLKKRCANSPHLEGSSMFIAQL